MSTGGHRAGDSIAAFLVVGAWAGIAAIVTVLTADTTDAAWIPTSRAGDGSRRRWLIAMTAGSAGVGFCLAFGLVLIQPLRTSTAGAASAFAGQGPFYRRRSVRRADGRTGSAGANGSLDSGEPVIEHDTPLPLQLVTGRPGSFIAQGGLGATLSLNPIVLDRCHGRVVLTGSGTDRCRIPALIAPTALSREPGLELADRRGHRPFDRRRVAGHNDRLAPGRSRLYRAPFVRPGRSTSALVGEVDLDTREVVAETRQPGLGSARNTVGQPLAAGNIVIACSNPPPSIGPSASIADPKYGEGSVALGARGRSPDDECDDGRRRRRVRRTAGRRIAEAAVCATGLKVMKEATAAMSVDPNMLNERRGRTGCQVKAGFPADRPPEVDVGEHLLAVHHLGGTVRRPGRRGASGVVVTRGDDGGIAVAFATGHTLRAHPDDVALPDPRDLPPPER